MAQRTRVQSLASLKGLRIPLCRELQCRSQTWLGSCIAVAVAQASRYSSDSTPSLGTSICHKCGPKKTKKKKRAVGLRKVGGLQTPRSSKIPPKGRWASEEKSLVVFQFRGNLKSYMSPKSPVRGWAIHLTA